MHRHQKASDTYKMYTVSRCLPSVFITYTPSLPPVIFEICRSTQFSLQLLLLFIFYYTWLHTKGEFLIYYVIIIKWIKKVQRRVLCDSCTALVTRCHPFPSVIVFLGYNLFSIPFFDQFITISGSLYVFNSDVITIPK